MNTKLEAIEKCQEIQQKFLDDVKDFERHKDDKNYSFSFDDGIDDDEDYHDEQGNHQHIRLNFNLDQPDIDELFCESEEEDLDSDKKIRSFKKETEGKVESTAKEQYVNQMTKMMEQNKLSTDN